jgi:hypothetical protein
MIPAAAIASSVGLAIAQQEKPHPSLPKTPTSYETRDAGGETETEASVRKDERTPRKVTFTAVTESREWKDIHGKVVKARLLTFEAPDGEELPLVKDGKIRLLVDGAKRFSLLPFETLSAADRTFITNLAAARKRDAAAR